jgi:HAD superfamily hydrolase (TIGR01457 family)
VAGLSFLIDMDGVVYHGNQAIPEAISFIESIQPYPYLFLTNNSSVTPEAVLRKLSKMGLPNCRLEHILTSAMATADYLQTLRPGFSYFAVGGPGLHASLEAHGTFDDVDPDYVVVGEGEGLDYNSLIVGINILLRRRAKLIGTNPDFSLDGTRAGQPVLLPGGGALIAPFQMATGIEPEFVGKPNSVIYQQALKRIGRRASEVIMIGDRPDTDIEGAARVGIRTILVCTGRFAWDEPYPVGLLRPDFTVRSLADVHLKELENMVQI